MCLTTRTKKQKWTQSLLPPLTTCTKLETQMFTHIYMYSKAQFWTWSFLGRSRNLANKTFAESIPRPFSLFACMSDSGWSAAAAAQWRSTEGVPELEELSPHRSTRSSNQWSFRSCKLEVGINSILLTNCRNSIPWRSTNKGYSCDNTSTKKLFPPNNWTVQWLLHYMNLF